MTNELFYYCPQKVGTSPSSFVPPVKNDAFPEGDTYKWPFPCKNSLITCLPVRNVFVITGGLQFFFVMEFYMCGPGDGNEYFLQRSCKTREAQHSFTSHCFQSICSQMKISVGGPDPINTITWMHFQWKSKAIIICCRSRVEKALVGFNGNKCKYIQNRDS